MSKLFAAQNAENDSAIRRKMVPDLCRAAGMGVMGVLLVVVTDAGSAPRLELDGFGQQAGLNGQDAPGKIPSCNK